MYSQHRIPRTAQTRRRNVAPTNTPLHNGRNVFQLGSIRPTALLLAKALLLPLASALPTSSLWHTAEETPKSPSDPNLYVYLGVGVILVLLGGAFAGLTIALMGQDETYLQVLAASGEGSEKKHAEKVLRLLNKGKHWVLVTLLLSNVITNETLPIVLDRSLGGGWPAVLSSTVLIVIFGEIVPQSICVRYGLPIGAFMAPVVLSLMWIMCPVAWPTAKLLDYLLGEDHGTMYKKAGLKTLVTLHKALGPATGERLMEDEVTIINSVLDLKDKPVGNIMTPMQDVFTMSADTILDESMMDTILSQGYSRIPIYAPDNNRNFIGMLLVKILITYDPEDARRVRDFSLATLPETSPSTSCLDIINFFQEGKSHMVLVSDFPGQDKGALGVVTLEDVIEELIGEEIIDESDVFVDVHKAIRRMAPAPQRRFKRDAGGLEPTLTHDTHMNSKEDASETEPLLSGTDSRKQSLTNGAPAQTFLIRRKSSNASEPANAIPMRSNTAEMREHLRHLGPSNVASKPRATKYSSVKIKPGVGTIPENQTTTKGTDTPPARSRSVDATPDANIPPPRSAGKEASDGTAAVRGYGTMASSPPASRPKAMLRGQSALEASQVAELKAQADRDGKGADGGLSFSSAVEPPPGIDGERSRDLNPPEKMVVGSSGSTHGGGQGRVVGEEDDLVSDLAPSRQRSQSRRQARSGSITETEVEIGGLKKVVLETTSSSSDEEGDDAKSARSGSWMGRKGGGSGKKGSGSSKD